MARDLKNSELKKTFTHFINNVCENDKNYHKTLTSIIDKYENIEEDEELATVVDISSFQIVQDPRERRRYPSGEYVHAYQNNGEKIKKEVDEELFALDELSLNQTLALLVENSGTEPSDGETISSCSEDSWLSDEEEEEDEEQGDLDGAEVEEPSSDGYHDYPTETNSLSDSRDSLDVVKTVTHKSKNGGQQPGGCISRREGLFSPDKAGGCIGRREGLFSPDRTHKHHREPTPGRNDGLSRLKISSDNEDEIDGDYYGNACQPTLHQNSPEQVNLNSTYVKDDTQLKPQYRPERGLNKVTSPHSYRNYVQFVTKETRDTHSCHDNETATRTRNRHDGGLFDNEKENRQVQRNELRVHLKKLNAGDNAKFREIGKHEGGRLQAVRKHYSLDTEIFEENNSHDIRDHYVLGQDQFIDGGDKRYLTRIENTKLVRTKGTAAKKHTSNTPQQRFGRNPLRRISTIHTPLNELEEEASAPSVNTDIVRKTEKKCQSPEHLQSFVQPQIRQEKRNDFQKASAQKPTVFSDEDSYSDTKLECLPHEDRDDGLLYLEPDEVLSPQGQHYDHILRPNYTKDIVNNDHCKYLPFEDTILQNMSSTNEYSLKKDSGISTFHTENSFEVQTPLKCANKLTLKNVSLVNVSEDRKDMSMDGCPDSAVKVKQWLKEVDHEPTEVERTSATPGQYDQRRSTKVERTSATPGRYDQRRSTKVERTRATPGRYDQRSTEVERTIATPGTYGQRRSTEVERTSATPWRYDQMASTEVERTSATPGRYDQRPSTEVQRKNVTPGRFDKRSSTELDRKNVTPGRFDKRPSAKLERTSATPERYDREQEATETGQTMLRSPDGPIRSRSCHPLKRSADISPHSASFMSQWNKLADNIIQSSGRNQGRRLSSEHGSKSVTPAQVFRKLKYGQEEQMYSPGRGCRVNDGREMRTSVKRQATEMMDVDEVMGGEMDYSPVPMKARRTDQASVRGQRLMSLEPELMKQDDREYFSNFHSNRGENMKSAWQPGNGGCQQARFDTGVRKELFDGGNYLNRNLFGVGFGKDRHCEQNMVTPNHKRKITSSEVKVHRIKESEYLPKTSPRKCVGDICFETEYYDEAFDKQRSNTILRQSYEDRTDEEGDSSGYSENFDQGTSPKNSLVEVTSMSTEMRKGTNAMLSPDDIESSPNTNAFRDCRKGDIRFYSQEESPLIDFERMSPKIQKSLQLLEQREGQYERLLWSPENARWKSDHNRQKGIQECSRWKASSNRQENTPERSRMKPGHNRVDGTPESSRWKSGLTRLEVTPDSSSRKTGINRQKDNPESFNWRSGHTRQEDTPERSRRKSGHTQQEDTPELSRRKSCHTQEETPELSRRKSCHTQEETPERSRKKPGHTQLAEIPESSRRKSGHGRQHETQESCRMKSGTTQQGETPERSRRNSGQIQQEETPKYSRRKLGNTRQEDTQESSRRKLGHTRQEEIQEGSRRKSGHTQEETREGSRRKSSHTQEETREDSRRKSGHTQQEETGEGSRRKSGHTQREETPKSSRKKSDLSIPESSRRKSDHGTVEGTPEYYGRKVATSRIEGTPENSQRKPRQNTQEETYSPSASMAKLKLNTPKTRKVHADATEDGRCRNSRDEDRVCVDPRKISPQKLFSVRLGPSSEMLVHGHTRDISSQVVSQTVDYSEGFGNLERMISIRDAEVRPDNHIYENIDFTQPKASGQNKERVVYQAIDNKKDSKEYQGDIIENDRIIGDSLDCGGKYGALVGNENRESRGRSQKQFVNNKRHTSRNRKDEIRTGPLSAGTSTGPVGQTIQPDCRVPDTTRVSNLLIGEKQFKVPMSHTVYCRNVHNSPQQSKGCVNDSPSRSRKPVNQPPYQCSGPAHESPSRSRGLVRESPQPSSGLVQSVHSAGSTKGQQSDLVRGFPVVLQSSPVRPGSRFCLDLTLSTIAGHEETSSECDSKNSPMFRKKQERKLEDDYIELIDA